MTQRPHDLAGLALTSFRFLAFPTTTPLNWETVLGIGVATLIGAALPDIDNVASRAWKFNLNPWEDDVTRSSLKGHRNLSHSFIGLGLFTFLLSLLLSAVKLPHLETGPVIEAFVLGYVSHLLTDSLTHDGVPWFYPIDIHLGFPPFKFMRMRTGGLIEKVIVIPLLLVFIVWIYYNYRGSLKLLFGDVS